MMPLRGVGLLVESTIYRSKYHIESKVFLGDRYPCLEHTEILQSHNMLPCTCFLKKARLQWIGSPSVWH
jgi:hypothetical protein